jgi:hypothetical protein
LKKYDLRPEIEEKIIALRNIELLLGNIPRDKFSLSEILTQDEDINRQKMEDLSSKAESLFISICRKCFKEGYSALKISKIINSYFETDGFLKYCDENEVKDAGKKH